MAEFPGPKQASLNIPAKMGPAAVTPKKPKARKPLPPKPASAEDAAKAAELGNRAKAPWSDGRYSDPAKALATLNQAIGIDANNAVLYYNRGLSYDGSKQYRKAVSDYSRAVKLNQKYARALTNRGNAYYHLAEYQKAIADDSRSIGIDPKNGTAYVNRGRAQCQADMFAPMCDSFKKACELNDCTGLEWAKNKGYCQ